MIQNLPLVCPICGGELTITRLHCVECDTQFEGRFKYGAFAHLSAEQINFIEAFIRCEGKLNRMEDELGMSYPKIRGRLNEIIRALGYEPAGSTETVEDQADQRVSILEALERGEISSQEAVSLLQGLSEK
ncbi:MAG: DUF2089 domain-containing protein [Anaerolineales bacterium]